ncbi:hypothetical protein D9613_006646 [Agrocybe pediades]|uniref:HAT C-terminal dimerisation domain-containing protein n=1 Tax=Agrocybe pediades TaxID=84607 RepID=A0A8H4QHQ5_9AGAR|nr:hypothetical protein D9613_006646 [Agrocybe pediades]
MDIRWSSTYLMIDRVLELYPAIDVLLNKVKHKDIHHHLLDDVQLQVLRDIAEFLRIPHAVQTILCAEKTPTLSWVLPRYEDLLDMLHLYRQACPQLQRAISVCVAKIEEYVEKSRSTRIYALAMSNFSNIINLTITSLTQVFPVINPIKKLKWIEAKWTHEQYKAAKEWVLAAMLEYRKARRDERKQQLRSNPGSSATFSLGDSDRSQADGIAYIHNLKLKLQRNASQFLSAASLTSVSNSQEDTVAGQLSSGGGDDEGDELTLEEKDKAAVEEELQRYMAEGVIKSNDYSGFSLTRYWQSRQHDFPTLYRVVLDILPGQASSVACERVFSSSKETITLRRSLLSPQLVEILQFLKYTYCQERLDLMKGLISSEEELLRAEIPSVSVDKARDLLVNGQIDELIELLNSEASQILHA